MPQTQTELALPTTTPLDAESAEEWHETLRRRLADACDEIGRKVVCLDNGISPQLLSKQLSGAEGKYPAAWLVPYCLRHEKSGRLAQWVADAGGFLAFQRPDLLTPAEALRQILALSVAGEVGNAARDRIRAIYERTAIRGEP